MRHLDAAQGSLLVAQARQAIARRLGLAGEPDSGALPAWLDEPGATFVTLSQNGNLRGCIGTLHAHRPLLDDLRANAQAAAFDDPRFGPLSREELPDTRVEVSVLAPAEPISFAGEAEALSQLRPGLDGVILEFGRHRATFLPQVWDQLPDPRQFLAHLKRKAGLAPEFWSDNLRLYRYGVEKFKEEQP